MKDYIYETENIPYNVWTGKVKLDYLTILNERGAQGWRFCGFSPHGLKPKGVKGTELIFEKELIRPEVRTLKNFSGQ